MLQTLVVMASIVVLAAAILTSTLVSAKNALHTAVVAKTSTAMTEATSQFTAWAQAFVYKYGTEANWDAKSAQPGPIFYPICAAKTNCPFNATIQWTVTGATVGPAAQSATTSSAQTPATAQNMAPAVDEQRISATISVTITNSTGRETYGGRTEEVTARVFDATPYVVVTAMRDLTADLGTVASSEGDTGGFQYVPVGGTHYAEPSLLKPAGYNDTIVRASIDCDNTPRFNEIQPKAPADNGTALVDYKFRSGGAQVWAFQLPCTPNSEPSAPSGLSDYNAPQGSTYEVGASNVSATWNKGDQVSKSFPR